MVWYALYTKPHSEKKVMHGVKQLGIQAYCPMYSQVRQWSDRKKKILVPAIRSYVFVKPEERKRNHVFEVPGVVRYLYWLGKPAVIWEHEIEAMRKALSGNVESVSVSHYKPGDSISIPNGLFKDKVAVIEKMDRKYVFLLLEQTCLQIVIRLV